MKLPESKKNMKAWIKICIAFTLLSLASCKSPKKLESTSEFESEKLERLNQRHQYQLDSISHYYSQRDSVYNLVVPNSQSNVTIDNPCDSLTGLLEKFEIQAGNTKIKSDGSTIKVTSECEEQIHTFKESNSDLKVKLLSATRSKDSAYAALEVEKLKNSAKSEVIEPWLHLKSFFLGIGLVLFIALVYKLVKWINQSKILSRFLKT